MKIVCESCSAKYSIADEKVAGRVFKIRCKKCGAAIVVRGDAGAAEETSVQAGGGGGAFADYGGGEAVWHVVVDGDQQGPFTPQQLGEMISATTIGWDAYVWREGFEDWKPAQDIEELVQAIMNPGAGAGAAAAEPADPFAGAEPTTAAPSKSKRDAGADLFAQSDTASPFGSGDDDVVSSAPSPRVSGNQAMTGARNENSVLFSLSNLQALATGGSGGGAASPSISSGAKPSTAAPRAGHATGEGSGLIDIRALASATGMTGGGAAPMGGLGAPSMSPPKVDDLLSIGAPVGGLGSALAAPVIIPEKKESSGGNNGLVYAIAGLAAAILLVGGGYIAWSMSQNDPAAIAAAPGGAAAAGAIAPGPTAATAGAPPAAGAGAPGAPAVAAGGTVPAAGGAEGTAPGGAAAPPEGTGATAAAGEPSGGGGGGGRRRGGGGGGGGGAASGGGTTTAAAGGSTGGGSTGGGASSGGGGGGGGGGGSRSLDDLLGRALETPRSGGGGGGGGAAASGGGGGGGGGGDLPETPSRSDVSSAIGRVAPAVTACGSGEHGTAPVAITISGSTGRVTNAVVSGSFAGTPVGSCIARAVRGATFPHFSRASFTVNYPFRI